MILCFFYFLGVWVRYFKIYYTYHVHIHTNNMETTSKVENIKKTNNSLPFDLVADLIAFQKGMCKTAISLKEGASNVSLVFHEVPCHWHSASSACEALNMYKRAIDFYLYWSNKLNEPVNYEIITVAFLRLRLEIDILLWLVQSSAKTGMRLEDDELKSTSSSISTTSVLPLISARLAYTEELIPQVTTNSFAERMQYFTSPSSSSSSNRLFNKFRCEF